MSRKKHRIDRLTPPDVVYGSVLVSKFINNLMLDGKKTVAEKVFYDAASRISETLKEEITEKGGFASWFESIIMKLRPSFGLKAKRIGGSTYQIPIDLPNYAAVSFAIKLIVKVIRSKSGRGTADILHSEFISIQKNEGEVMKKRSEFEKRIESSKVFSNSH